MYIAINSVLSENFFIIFGLLWIVAFAFWIRYFRKPKHKRPYGSKVSDVFRERPFDLDRAVPRKINDREFRLMIFLVFFIAIAIALDRTFLR